MAAETAPCTALASLMWWRRCGGDCCCCYLRELLLPWAAHERWTEHRQTFRRIEKRCDELSGDAWHQVVPAETVVSGYSVWKSVVKEQKRFSRSCPHAAAVSDF